MHFSFTLALLLACSSCVGNLKIHVGKELPMTFYFSGGGSLGFLQVSGGGKPIWKLYPKDNVDTVYLRKISSIKYGEVPPNCIQVIPEVGAPPPLVEGEYYGALGNVFYGPPADITFTIKNGQVIEIPD